MVVVDKLSKEAQFIRVKKNLKAANITEIFMKEFFRLNDIPRVIIFYRDPKFTHNFWKYLLQGLDTKLNFSTAYHPQTDGHT